MLNGERGKALAARMPCERVLTESDRPFAQIDGRVALPWEVDRAVTGLADLWDGGTQQIQSVLNDKFRVPHTRHATHSRVLKPTHRQGLPERQSAGREGMTKVVQSDVLQPGPSTVDLPGMVEAAATVAPFPVVAREYPGLFPSLESQRPSKK